MTAFTYMRVFSFQVLHWLLEQRNSDTIEEVTDEMLVKLINTHQYVAVYFSKLIFIC